MDEAPPLQQCMGGWCTRRETCPHYWAPRQPFSPPAERLCERRENTYSQRVAED